MSSGVKDYHHLIQLVGAEEGVDLLLNDEGKLLVAAAVGGIVVLIGKM